MSQTLNLLANTSAIDLVFVKRMTDLWFLIISFITRSRAATSG